MQVQFGVNAVISRARLADLSARGAAKNNAETGCWPRVCRGGPVARVRLRSRDACVRPLAERDMTAHSLTRLGPYGCRRMRVGVGVILSYFSRAESDFFLQGFSATRVSSQGKNIGIYYPI